MRIGMLLSCPLPPREGIGFYTWNLARYLTGQGHRVHLITRGSLAPTTREEVEGVTIWRPTFVPLYPYHVHLHTFFVNRLLKALEPELDLIHLHDPLVKAPNTKLPILVTVHSSILLGSRAIELKDLLSLLIRLQTPVSVQLEREAFKRARRIFTVASSVARDLALYGIDPKDVAVLGNGTNTSVFFPKSSKSIGAKYVLAASRLAPRKGLEDLLECAQLVSGAYPEIQFWIAGGGPLRGKLEKAILRKNLQQKVILLGHISQREKMADLYRSALIFVHAAHYEGLPTVILEAMACGAPVISTAVSGALDVIKDGKNGLLVPPRDPQLLAEAILGLLQNPTLATNLSEEASQTIRENYSWTTIGSGYVREYERILD